MSKIDTVTLSTFENAFKAGQNDKKAGKNKIEFSDGCHSEIYMLGYEKGYETACKENSETKYSYFQSASGKLVIEGPGLAIGDIRVEIHEQANIICSALERVFKAGKNAKAKEIKDVLNDGQ